MEELLASTKRQDTTLILSAVSSQPLEAMRQSGLLERLGKENIADNIFDALERAKAVIETPPNEQRVHLASKA
jgi:hypothetical protein